ncbi:hypothetical protein JW698_03025 [Candidatus Wolfebacteria bacterium]|nr:hypothetical protein [Candidatus Wolfebacteria bacterium]
MVDLIKRNKKLFVIFIIAIIAAGFCFFLWRINLSEPELKEELAEVENYFPKHKIIGQSVEGREIEAFIFGQGEKFLLFVGGIHGGYEWNSSLLAYEFIDYFNINSEIIPENVSVAIIPCANPDGLYKATGKEGRFILTDIPSGVSLDNYRFNANNVDLNRNFDCKWKPESTWRNKIVSAGTAPFSEPEALVIRDFVLENNPLAVVFWHSQANAVYASECENGVLPETLKIMRKYSLASGYPAIASFDAYEVTGDAEGWLASIGIPALTVELKTHEDIEWGKNLAGVKALLEYYK